MCAAVSSEPAATWVLLGSELTGVRGQPATTIKFKGRSEVSPASSSSSSAYFSPLTPGRALSDSSYSSNSHLNSVETSPEVDGDSVSVTSSSGSRLLEFLRPILSAINSQGNIQASVGSERSGTKTPEPAGQSAPPTVVSKAKMHRKIKSCSQISDFESLPQKLPKYVETPEMNTLLRVQPHAIGGHGEMSGGAQDSAPQWECSRVFDVYVHPATLPEMSNHYHSSTHLGSFLVQLKPAKHSKSNSPQSQGQNGSSNLPPASMTSSDPPPSSHAESDSVTSPVSDTGFELSRIMSVVSSSFQDSPADASNGASKSSRPLNLVLPDFLVVRLCFATTLVSGQDGRVGPLPPPPPSTTPKAFADSKRVLTVAPGHIVMSNVVRRQLRITSFSLVRVCNVKEEGRLPFAHRTVSIHLRPLNEESSIMKMVCFLSLSLPLYLCVRKYVVVK